MKALIYKKGSRSQGLKVLELSEFEKAKLCKTSYANEEKQEMQGNACEDKIEEVPYVFLALSQCRTRILRTFEAQ